MYVYSIKVKLICCSLTSWIGHVKVRSTMGATKLDHSLAAACLVVINGCLVVLCLDQLTGLAHNECCE